MTKYKDAGVNLDEYFGSAEEAEGVIENILGSMLGSMEKHIANPNKRKRPKAEGYRAILLDDLRGRGFDVVYVGRCLKAAEAASRNVQERK